MEIGERIKLRREELGISQDELAIKVGYKSRSSINKIEVDGRGLPQKKIQLIADALYTTPAYLLGWETEYVKPGEIRYMSEDHQMLINAISELSANDIKLVMDMVNRMKKQ